MIKAVIFDIDNTLYDYSRADLSGRRAVEAYCRQQFGMEKAQTQEYYQKAWHLGERRVGTDTAAIHNRMIRFQCMMELMGQPIFPHTKALYHTYWDAMIGDIEPFPGIAELFQSLKEKGIRIGIGTDMTAYIQYRKLEALGLCGCIDFIVTSEEAGVEKPHPRFFQLCVEKAGCRAKECAFIGDNLKKDVEGSIASGLCGVFYSRGAQPAQEMPFPVIQSYQFLLQKI